MNNKTKIGVAAGGAVAIALAYMLVSPPEKPTAKKMFTATATNPWTVPFPFETMNKRNVSDSAGLNTALTNAQPNDWIILADGTYAGQFVLNKAATATTPILVSSNLADPDAHVVVNGGFKINGEQNYVWGMDITGGSVSGIDMFCKNCGAINNVIHGQIGGVGIGAWNTGKQILYGNIIYTMVSNGNNPHNIYTQNDFDKYGYKYFVQNYLADPAQTGNTYIFHAYAQGNYISGYWLEQNILVNGQVLVGSKSDLQPDHDQVFKDNLLFGSALRPCFSRPTWYTATGNYLGESLLRSECQWGDPEPIYPAIANAGATIVKNNSFVQAAPKDAFNMYTYAYAPDCAAGQNPACPRVQGTPTISTADDVDFNRYVPGFKGNFFAGGVQKFGVPDLATWQNLTQAAGGKFDANSTVAPSEPNKQFFLENEYDPNRGMLAVYNWEVKPDVTFTHTGTLSVYKIKDTFGVPIASGVGSVTIPTPNQFETFLIKISEPPPPTCPCDIEAADAELLKAIQYINQNKRAKARTAVNNARTILAPCL